MAPYDSLQEKIIIFTRYPLAGKVKTRLIPTVGRDEAARIHKHLAEKTVAMVCGLARQHRIGATLCFTGASRQQMRDWLGEELDIVEQQGVDLGERMAAAFQAAWNLGAVRAVLIGTDCPSLDARIIVRTLGLLRGCDVVLGPAADGGYYLIGLTNKVTDGTLTSLFRNVVWGSTKTFSQTFERARTSGLSISTLHELHDIDRPEDLKYISHHSDPQ